MFESLCLRTQSKTDPANPIDLGLLAESMLFYPKVLVIARKGELKQLATRFAPDILIEFLKAGHLQLQYEFDTVGIQTRNSGSPHERHSGIVFNSPNLALQNIGPEIFAEVTGKSGKGRRLANRFASHVTTVERGPNILTDFKADLLDTAFIQTVVRKLLALVIPEYALPNPFTFNIVREGDEFAVNTNINFVEANKVYHRRIPPSHSSLSPAYILAHILTVRENLCFASTLASDISLDPVSSKLLAVKVNGILDRYSNNTAKIEAFQDFLFDEGKAISDAINSGNRSFKDLLKLLDQADKFRGWLKDKPPEANLVKEYFHEVTKSSWIDKLPGKSFRWSFFTAAGLVIDSLGGGGIGTAAGVVIGAADSFVLDKLIKGWKPNHFVEGPLERFLKD